jgi:hypothetical protein
MPHLIHHPGAVLLPFNHSFLLLHCTAPFHQLFYYWTALNCSAVHSQLWLFGSVPERAKNVLGVYRDPRNKYNGKRRGAAVLGVGLPLRIRLGNAFFHCLLIIFCDRT